VTTNKLALAIALVALATLLGCSGKRPDTLGAADGMLYPCPSTPNCVSSDARADDPEHAIEAFALAAAPDVAWPAVVEAVEALPRTVIVTNEDGYLHAECTSALMRYVDDLELQLRPEQKLIAVRSASRIGRSDLGVNRERVESLRASLRARGVVE